MYTNWHLQQRFSTTMPSACPPLTSELSSLSPLHSISSVDDSFSSSSAKGSTSSTLMRRHLLPSHNWIILAFLFVRAWRDSRCKSWKKLFIFLAELGLFWGEASPSGVECAACAKGGLVLPGVKKLCCVPVALFGVFWPCLGEVSIALVQKRVCLSLKAYCLL